MSFKLFFYNVIPHYQFGESFFQASVLTAKLLYLIAGGFTEHVTFEALLAGFDKVFVPFVIGAVGDALFTARFSNAALATDTLHDMRTFWSEVKIRLVLRRISFNKDSEGLILDEPDELFFVVIVQR